MEYFKSPSNILIIFFAIFLLTRFSVGFTEPSSNPPSGNVPAPLNISSSGQSKSGGLVLNTGGAANGLIVDQGNVGIGTQNPTQKLDVIGYIRGATGLCIGGDCRTSWPATYTPTCPSGYVDAGDYCIEQNSRSPQDWWGAAATCRNAGAQLCSLVQWYPACSAGIANGMTSNIEWIGDMAYHVSQFHAVYIGYPGPGSCSSGTVAPPGAQSHNFRCCVNK